MFIDFKAQRRMQDFLQTVCQHLRFARESPCEDWHVLIFFIPCANLWGVMRNHGVDDRLLLAVNSLYSCSESLCPSRWS